MLENRRVQIMVFVAALLLQTAATIGALVYLDLPISTEYDSVEYINTADNVLARGRFSIEDAPPFRPNGFRTPGPLLINITLRLLSFKNDIAVALISRLLVLLAALLGVAYAAQLGVDEHALLAGPLLILTPTMFYYSMLAYSTELPYALVSISLQLGTVLYLNNASRVGVLMIGLSALYALYLRPAALFVLIAYAGTCALAAIVTKGPLRRRVVIAAAVCVLGTGTAYVSWCYRNYLVFDAFQYSTVSADNLLKWNARGMEPFLDPQGEQELAESLKKFPISLQRYSGSDQFVLANQESRAGLRLIVRHPMAFLKSHFRGVLESTFIFRPAALESLPPVMMIVMSAVYFGYFVLGSVGLVLLCIGLNVARRTALLIILVTGVISILTGGSTHSPRFRIPLDISLVVGTLYCVARIRSPHRASPSALIGR
jgi:hypothetical protein